MNIHNLIAHFSLQPHPEGGHFKETYRASENIPKEALPERFSPEPSSLGRSIGTAILFLLQKGETSRFHTIKSDEIWHFHAGDPLKICEITPQGALIETTLGLDYVQGQVPQYTVKAGHDFGSYTMGAYSFVGCTVAPGFDFLDFEFSQKKELYQRAPQAQSIIEKLTT